MKKPDKALTLVISLLILSGTALSFIIISHHSNDINKISVSKVNLNVRNFSVYYGSVVNESIISYLNNFSMVIIQPDIFSHQNLTEIRPLKIAYIDLGEFDGTVLGNYSINVSSIAIGYDSNWNQTIVNVSSPIWKNFIIYMVNQSISLGFNGVLFDDLDVVEQYPWELQGFINIISYVREDFPSIIIGVNRGFPVIPYINKYINFVMYEDFGSYYDFNSSTYAYLNSTQILTLKQRVSYFKSLGLVVVGLGYSSQPFNQMYYFDESLGSQLNVPVYISNLSLSATWQQNLT